MMMLKFLKLTTTVINTSKNMQIHISPTKYTMILCNSHFDGLLFVGSGGIQSTDSKIEICKNKHPEDYQIMKEWIDKL